MHRSDLKRIFDFVVALLAIIVLSPIFGLVAGAISRTMGRPILFRQQRPGLHGKPFTLLKFRTMTDSRDSNGQLLPDAQRLTKLGRFLRATSLDELPELVNVLRGDMSLVGPRPLLLQYLPFFSEEENLRHSVRPGITGWAQIHGRNLLSWDERLECDVWYVRNQSFGLDMRIMFVTFWKILKRDGVVTAPNTLMKDFDVERRARANADTAS